uniref:helix-turn-helix domain-containing protein n=1 Tax=Streptomyces noursei TaxID=1971 RepID=UPI00289D9F83
MQAAELFEQKVKPPEVARRLRVSRKSAYQWHQMWRTAICSPWPRVARADGGAVCRRAVWRSWPGTWSRLRPRTVGWRTRCGSLPG